MNEEYNVIKYENDDSAVSVIAAAEESPALNENGNPSATGAAIKKGDNTSNDKRPRADTKYTPDFSLVSNGHSFQDICVIARTNSSLVYRVKENNEAFVLKVYFKIIEMTEEEEYESKILKIIDNIANPYIAKPIDYWVSDKHFFLLSPYYPLGDLETVLNNKERKDSLGISTAKFILETFIPQALSAIKALHDNNLLHKDIKPSNFFLTKAVDGSIQILLHDFGSAVFVDNVGDLKFNAWRNEFSPPYKAPEVNQDRFNAKADYFSLGVTILDLYLGMPWYRYGGFKYEPTDAANLTLIISQGILSYISKYKNVDENVKIEEIIQNLIANKISERWDYSKVNTYITGGNEADFITFELVIIFKKTYKINNFQALFDFVSESVDHWNKFANEIKEFATKPTPTHYLKETVIAYPNTSYAFEQLAKSYDPSTFKDEHYIVFNTILLNHFSSNIIYRSYRPDIFSENDVARNVFDIVSHDIFEAIHNRGQFEDNLSLKNDLYHFIASGALADYINASKTNFEKAESLKQHAFNYKDIAELNPIIYLLSNTTPLIIGKQTIKTVSELFALIEEIGRNSYRSDGTVTLNEAALDIVKYLKDGTIMNFLTRASSVEYNRASFASNVIKKLNEDKNFIMLSRSSTDLASLPEQRVLIFMLFYFLITPKASFYFNKQAFSNPDALIKLVLSQKNQKQLPAEFINLNKDILFLYWIKGIEEGRKIT